MDEILGNLRLLSLFVGCMSYIYMMVEVNNESVIDIHFLIFFIIVLLNILKAYTQLFDRFIPGLIHMYLLDFGLGFMSTFIIVFLLLLL